MSDPDLRVDVQQPVEGSVLMPDVDEIIERLRAGAKQFDYIYGTSHVRLADAEAAVVAAVDARTAEIVKALTEQARAIPLGDRSEDSYNVAIRLVREVARRFPNGGTNDGK